MTNPHYKIFQVGLQGNGRFLFRKVRYFLKMLRAPTWVVIHFQNFEAKTYTAVVEIKDVYWVEELDRHTPYARLDFKHPARMGAGYSSPNFWAGFLLAIAPVESEEEFFSEDPEGSEFLRLVSANKS